MIKRHNDADGKETEKHRIYLRNHYLFGQCLTGE